ncbi:MAG: MBOAT family protein [Holophagales bacterium]|nr:MBOAT family protein [Holophagales bacterium]
MVFSTSLFLLFFLPAFLAGYHLLPRPARNTFVLLASALFYAWGAPRFLFVVLGVTFLDFHFVKRMAAANGPARKRAWLVASLAMNLGLLGYFKYAGFFVGNVNALLGAAGLGPLPWAEVFLPLGISFYTFETVTYVVDVYRGVHAPLGRFADYQLYILFFPKLLAGPIVRFHEIADQIGDRSRYETAGRFLGGFVRFVLGLAKKVLIADVLGVTVRKGFALDAAALDAPAAWLLLAAFLTQIYFDFSGYSDMALGLAAMVGFRLPENFRDPFVSTSVTEFWTRWHVTLSAWMRSYLYVPLGGNRLGTRRTLANLWIVFLVSGLWHGAAWHYVLWGAWHGLFIVAERTAFGRLLAKAGPVAGRAYVFLAVVASMALFRPAGLLSENLRTLAALAGGGSGTAALPLDREFAVTLGVALVFTFFAALPGAAAIQRLVFDDDPSLPRQLALFPAAGLLLLLCLSMVAWSPFSPFVYFRF